jgi:hypothetical protein
MRELKLGGVRNTGDGIEVYCWYGKNDAPRALNLTNGEALKLARDIITMLVPGHTTPVVMIERR